MVFFIRLKYKDSYGKMCETKGFFQYNSENHYGNYFFEKSTDAGKNSFYLFDKILDFEYSEEDFRSIFL